MNEFDLNSRLATGRTSYEKRTLLESSVHREPLRQFEMWMNEAYEADNLFANAMVLSTVDESLMPSSRVMLLRNLSFNGFTFFTNYHSRKGKDLTHNSKASMLFFWPQLERQVRIEGRISLLPGQESDEYFASRPYESKLAAWASNQSERVASREELDMLYKVQKDNYTGEEVPRPPHWGGYVLVPSRIEFWQGRPDRMHDRLIYRLDPALNQWNIERLMP